MRVGRILVLSWLFQLKNLMRSGLFVFTAVIEPLILATLAFYLFRAGDRSGTLLYAALGAGVMGIWTTTLYGSGTAIAGQRRYGTLELLVAAPPPLILIVVPLTLATATIGIYSMAATLLWGWLAFGVPFDLAHPFWFVLALVTGVVGLGLFGLLIASSFVLYRNASALVNTLEFPIALVTGILVPVALLPGWARPLSWPLSTTWAVEGIRRAAFGGSPLPAIALCLALGATYIALSAAFVAVLERRARERATLSLT